MPGEEEGSNRWGDIAAGGRGKRRGDGIQCSTVALTMLGEQNHMFLCGKKEDTGSTIWIHLALMY